MAKTTPEEFDWNPFMGRALAYLCLHFADLQGKTRLDQADFLMGLGLPRKEAATVLGTSDDSLRVLANQRAAKQRKGALLGVAVGVFTHTKLNSTHAPGSDEATRTS